MSAFQDFSYLSERRRAERAQRRKRMMIAAGAVSVILVVAVCAAAAVVYNSKSTSSTATTTANSSSSSSNSTKGFQVSSAVQVLCAPTDNRTICESTLKDAVNSTSSPKDLVRAAVAVIVDEVRKAFEKSDAIGTADPAVKSAVEVCQKLHKYEVAELNSTLNTIDAYHLNKLPEQVHELKNWLSAAATYQETCIDGFPDGEQKDKMRAAMTTAKQLTSNALAIVGSLSSFLSLIKIGGGSGGRRLLAKEQKLSADHSKAIGEDDLPNWVRDGDRRFLTGRAAKQLSPNVTVAKDGSGDFKTISEALAKIPSSYDGRYVIYVKEGVYEEQVVVDTNMVNVTMYGDGSRKSVITGSKNFVDGTKTFETATFAAIGDGFIAIAIGFQNTAGAAKHQAVALRVQSDRSIFLNCRMEAYQDTLYAHTHRQFYRGCLILGTVDFIFGNAAAIFQNCIFSVRRPLDNQQNIVLAQGRTGSHETTGFVVHNTRFTAEPDLVAAAGKIPSYIGRPWKEFSHTVVMESEIGDFISPDGYMPWDGDFALKTLSYTEYGNKGAGADTSKRIKWPGFKVIGRNEAAAFTPTTFIQGDDWIPKTGTPVRLGLFD
ncbi:pectinesterase-like [Curcuma longa]|uniref:pectinesterase-like n=1 Tax=Curcuma longa TaxID=136217 RepID=UPI003D9E9F2B